MADLKSGATEEVAAGTELGAEAVTQVEQQQPTNPLLALVQLQRLLSDGSIGIKQREMIDAYEALIPALEAKLRSICPQVPDPKKEGSPAQLIVRCNSTTEPIISPQVSFSIMWKSAVPGDSDPVITDSQFEDLAASVARLYGLKPGEYEIDWASGNQPSTRFCWNAKPRGESGIEKAGLRDIVRCDTMGLSPDVNMPITALLDGVSEGEQILYAYQTLSKERNALNQRLEAITEGEGGLSELHEKLMDELKKLLVEVCPSIERYGFLFRPSFTLTAPFRRFAGSIFTNGVDSKIAVTFEMEYKPDDPDFAPASCGALTTNELHRLAERIALLRDDNIEVFEESRPEYSSVRGYWMHTLIRGRKPEKSGDFSYCSLVRMSTQQPTTDASVPRRFEIFVPLGAVTRRNIPVAAGRSESAQAAQGVMKEQ